MQAPAPRRFPLKFNRTWTVLGLALAIGAIAAVSMRSYLAAQIDAIEARGMGKTVEVVVARTEIKAGATLSERNLAIRKIPAEYAHSVAVTPANFDRVDGRAIAYDVKPGEMILWGLLETKKAPTFSARIGAGHRAITVPVDEINSISGMLEPEDRIDLMATRERDGHRVTVPLLQQVRVMATGQRSVDDLKTGERRQYSTVTLDTTPEQAQSIIAARETGKLTALLRNPDDKQVIRTVSDQGHPGNITTRAAKRVIPILYGNAGGYLPEALKLGPDANAAALPAVPGSRPAVLARATQ